MLNYGTARNSVFIHRSADEHKRPKGINKTSVIAFKHDTHAWGKSPRWRQIQQRCNSVTSVDCNCNWNGKI